MNNSLYSTALHIQHIAKVINRQLAIQNGRCYGCFVVIADDEEKYLWTFDNRIVVICPYCLYGLTPETHDQHCGCDYCDGVDPHEREDQERLREP